ncbi:hypothetical protein AX16_010585 [Volvariella volvacea WC 439]|nr:hypothetical protein AX16_010585 [Volvariella volvacea WC 439]
MAQESSQNMAVEIMSNALPTTNGIHVNGHGEPSLEILEAELPVVDNEQVPLGEVLSRFAQTIYAELVEMAETLPNTSDAARKRTIADWVVRTKKQAVKLYAVAKWARDAETVQKSMNITAFLMNQNHQFEEAMRAIQVTKDALDPARLRNHDLLTSLDVLTTGSYLRLPTCIKKTIIPPTPLTDDEIDKILSDMEDVIRYRLRMAEIIPVEMSSHRIADGRVYFTVPNLFETSICLRGAEPQEGWFFVHVEFLFNVGGDLTGLQEFPRTPTGIMKRHIAEEADNRLGKYVPLPPDAYPPGVEIPPRPTLPEGTVDAPLVRLYNFLQMMSLSYQLEILWYQASRMRALGWADYLSVQMSRDRKTMTVNYWLRPTPNQPSRQRLQLPSHGGTLTIAIVEVKSPPKLGGGPARTHKARILSRIQYKSQLGAGRPSDEVEGLRFSVKWAPSKGALGVVIPPQELTPPADVLSVNPNNLDFEAMLRTILEKHSRAILNSFHYRLRNGPARSIFSRPNDVKCENDALWVHMCADEVAVVSIDIRTGRLSLRDTGDLAAAGRGPQFIKATETVNTYPMGLEFVLADLRLTMIMESVEQKAKYLGLRVFRHRNFPQHELARLGNPRRNLFIQLANFPSSDHYLVVVATDSKFRFALITTTIKSGSGNALNAMRNEPMSSYMVMEDIAWLDLDRIRNQDLLPHRTPSDMEEQDPFHIETQVLKELYGYCCARVAYMNVERQLKLRGIPFTHVSPSSGPIPPELMHIQSPLARSVPALCVQASDILSGAPAAEAAMPNIRVVPLNWWSDKDAQVITCVKLKYVQQPMGRSTTTSSVIRPSKRIIYDTTEAVVSFLSQDVKTCVNEFLEEWARVSKMVVIAREIAQMAKNEELQGVKLLSFDLQTVEFLYGLDYTVSLSCEDQLSFTGGNFILRFGRYRPRRDASGAPIPRKDNDNLYNPHDEAESFFQGILRHGKGLAPSLHRLVMLLRDTLPIVAELEEIRLESEKESENVDTFAKSAGWYRLLYGDLRHALDFRLLHDKRVAIIDASHCVCLADRKKNVTASNDPNSSSSSDSPGLQPIPQFSEVIISAAKQAVLRGSAKPGRVAVIDVGVVCDASAVQGLGRIIHRGVVEKLKAQSGSSASTTTTTAPNPSTSATPSTV